MRGFVASAQGRRAGRNALGALTSAGLALFCTLVGSPGSAEAGLWDVHLQSCRSRTDQTSVELPSLPVGCALGGCCLDCSPPERVDWRVVLGGPEGVRLHVILEGDRNDAGFATAEGAASRLAGNSAFSAVGEGFLRGLPFPKASRAVVGKLRLVLPQPSPPDPSVGDPDKAATDPVAVSFTLEQLHDGRVVTTATARWTVRDCLRQRPGTDRIDLDHNIADDEAVVLVSGRREFGCSGPEVWRTRDVAYVGNLKGAGKCTERIFVLSEDDPVVEWRPPPLAKGAESRAPVKALPVLLQEVVEEDLPVTAAPGSGTPDPPRPGGSGPGSQASGKQASGIRDSGLQDSGLQDSGAAAHSALRSIDGPVDSSEPPTRDSVGPATGAGFSNRAGDRLAVDLAGERASLDVAVWVAAGGPLGRDLVVRARNDLATADQILNQSRCGVAVLGMGTDVLKLPGEHIGTALAAVSSGSRGEACGALAGFRAADPVAYRARAVNVYYTSAPLEGWACPESGIAVVGAFAQPSTLAGLIAAVHGVPYERGGAVVASGDSVMVDRPVRRGRFTTGQCLHLNKGILTRVLSLGGVGGGDGDLQGLARAVNRLADLPPADWDIPEVAR